MILSELGEYLKANNTVSQQALSKKFAISPDGVDAMLAVWIRKGRVSRQVHGNQVRYHWLGDNEIGLTVHLG